MRPMQSIQRRPRTSYCVRDFPEKEQRRAAPAFFCAEFNSSYACEKLRVTRVSRLTTASHSIGGHGDFVHWRRGPAVAQGYGVASRGYKAEARGQAAERALQSRIW